MIMRQRFLCSQKRNFSWIQQKTKNFPHRPPNIKIDHFCNVMSIDVTKVGDFYNGGYVGKFLIFCRIQLKFRFWSYKKRWHTSCKFQFEKTRNKKVIAQKPLTILNEMNSSCVFCMWHLLRNSDLNLYDHLRPTTLKFMLMHQRNTLATFSLASISCQRLV